MRSSLSRSFSCFSNNSLLRASTCSEPYALRRWLGPNNVYLTQVSSSRFKLFCSCSSSNLYCSNIFSNFEIGWLYHLRPILPLEVFVHWRWDGCSFPYFPLSRKFTLSCSSSFVCTVFWLMDSWCRPCNSSICLESQTIFSCFALSAFARLDGLNFSFVKCRASLGIP